MSLVEWWKSFKASRKVSKILSRHGVGVPRQYFVGEVRQDEAGRWDVLDVDGWKATGLTGTVLGGAPIGMESYLDMARRLERE